MRILVLTKRYYTHRDLLSDRFGRLFHLPRVLSQFGNSVCVMALDYRTFEKKSLVEDGLHLLSLPSRSRGAISPLAKNEVQSEIHKGFDVIIGSGHLQILFHAIAIGKKLNCPVVVEAYDYYPAFFRGLLRVPAQFWFASLCRKSDGCVAASAKLGRRLSNYKQRTIVIENGFDPNLFRKRTREEAVRGLGLEEGSQYIGYTGTASRELGFYDLVEAVRIIRKANPETFILHVGHSHQIKSDLEEVISLGERSQKDVALALSACTCGVVPYRESLQVRYSNSCKLVEYIALGLPVVATRTGDNERILGSDFPYLVSPGDPRALAEAIKSQIEDRLVSPYPHQWTWEQLGRKLEKFLFELTAE